jgi:hypothetical protein
MASISKEIYDTGKVLPMPVVQRSIGDKFGMQRFREEVLFCPLAFFEELRGCLGRISEKFKEVCRTKGENTTNTPNFGPS